MPALLARPSACAPGGKLAPGRVTSPARGATNKGQEQGGRTDSTDSQATARLVTAARAGDHAAFASLIQRHYPMVHALCTRALGDTDLARDAAQEPR